MSTIEVGELLYEYTVKITGMTEYGVSLESLMAGEVAPPPEGARRPFPTPHSCRDNRGRWTEDCSSRRWRRPPAKRQQHRRSPRERDLVYLFKRLHMGQCSSGLGHRDSRSRRASRSAEGLFGVTSSIWKPRLITACSRCMPPNFK